MNLEQEAKAAAEAAYEVDVYTTAQVARGKRVPFAHGYVTGFAAALADLPAALDRVMCTVCEGDGEFIQSPTGSWWAHESHPADHHDYAPGLRP